MWWKLLVPVTVVALCCNIGLSDFQPKDVIEEILVRLGLTLNYVSKSYEDVNVDCLFGVVLAGAILDDVGAEAGPYQDRIKDLRVKVAEIYAKTLPLMGKEALWDYFATYITVPELWRKRIKYKLSEFRTAYPVKSRVRALFSMETYENYTEGFSDECMSSVINNTLDLKPQAICRLSPRCEQFVESMETGSGYILTHKLLLLQISRARRCKMHPKLLANAIKKSCSAIYTETISVEYFLNLDDVFDLFLEQILLCGYEGYADFLKMPWLEKIFQVQHASGCFPAVAPKRSTRETHVFTDGCADHTTGLAAAVFSLYLNYVMKNSDAIVFMSEWFSR